MDRLENAAWLCVVGCACLTLSLFVWELKAEQAGRQAVVRIMGNAVYLLSPTVVNASSTGLR